MVELYVSDVEWIWRCWDWGTSHIPQIRRRHRLAVNDVQPNSCIRDHDDTWYYCPKIIVYACLSPDKIKTNRKSYLFGLRYLFVQFFFKSKTFWSNNRRSLINSNNKIWQKRVAGEPVKHGLKNWYNPKIGVDVIFHNFTEHGLTAETKNITLSGKAKA